MTTERALVVSLSSPVFVGAIASHALGCYTPLMDWVMYTKVFVSLLFMVDPVAAIPTYLASTEGESRLDRRRTARIAALAVACVLILFTLAGEHILCLLYTSPSPRDISGSRMPSSA